MANWFYTDSNGNRHGAFNDQQLKVLAMQGIVTPETPLETDMGHKGKAQQIPWLFPTPLEFDPHTFPTTTDAVPPNISAPVEIPNPFQSFGNSNENTYKLTLRGYRDISTISLVTVIISVFLLIVTVIMIPCQLLEYDVLTKIQTGVYETEEEIESAADEVYTVTRIFALLSVVFILASGVLFLFWTYRFVKNAHSISSRPLRFGPGWAVGYYFIPVLCLFRPYQALSDAHRVSKNPSDWTVASSSHLLGWWWALLLLSGIAGRVIGRISMRELEIDALITLNVWTTLSYLVLDIPLYVLTIYVIRKLTASQQDAYRQVINSPQLLT